MNNICMVDCNCNIFSLKSKKTDINSWCIYDGGGGNISITAFNKVSSTYIGIGPYYPIPPCTHL